MPRDFEHTFEDMVKSQEVCADRSHNHGKGKTQQLEDHMSIMPSASTDE
jgi:hypothetical protein